MSNVVPGIRTSKSGQLSFCNQMIIVLRGWIDKKNVPGEGIKFGDNSKIPMEILEDIANFT